MMDGVDDMNSNTDEEESEDETDSEGDVQGRGEDMENDGGNKRMVEKLFTNNIIKSQEVLSVMKQVNRGNYVRHNPYKSTVHLQHHYRRSPHARPCSRAAQGPSEARHARSGCWKQDWLPHSQHGSHGGGPGQGRRHRSHS